MGVADHAPYRDPGALVCAVAELTGMNIPKGSNEIPDQFASTALANEIIVANCFLSLRLLCSATNWKDFFEQTSQVEMILRDDPAEIYAGPFMGID